MFYLRDMQFSSYRTSIHCDFVIMPPYFVDVSATRLLCLSEFSYFYGILFFLTPPTSAPLIFEDEILMGGVWLQL